VAASTFDALGAKARGDAWRKRAARGRG